MFLNHIIGYVFRVKNHIIGCKGTKKNVYVQENFIFIALGYIFL